MSSLGVIIRKDGLPRGITHQPECKSLFNISLFPDPYANLYDLDDEEAVSTVMRNMLDKDLVKEAFRKDLGFDDASKVHDPRLKMVLRHQRVKENREKREAELKRQRREAESKKQARLTARQIVMKVRSQRRVLVIVVIMILLCHCNRFRGF